jgi:hypothetical protein
MNEEIKLRENGSLEVVSGREHMGLLRMVMVARGLHLEIRTGMRLTSKAPKCSTIARRDYKLKGRPEVLYEKMMDLIQAKRIELGVSPEQLSALVI